MTSGRVYRAETLVFGKVEIKTKQDLSRMSTLYLAHPWLDTLLDREHTSVDIQSGAFVEDDAVESSSPAMDDDIEDDVAEPSSGSPDMNEEDISDEENDDDSVPLPGREHELSSLTVLIHTVPMDRETRALRLVARLRQSFGALLLTLTSTRRRAVAYRRVAADNVITVQMGENLPLADLLDNVRILDVL